MNREANQSRLAHNSIVRADKKRMRDRATRIREVNALIADRANRPAVLSNIVVTPDTDPMFATLPDLESFLRHSNLTPALQEFVRQQNTRNLSNIDSEACSASIFIY